MAITDNYIRTRPNPDCHVCGTNGEPLYQCLRDRLFSAPGEWNLKKCPNPQCGLVWLDPMPIEEDISKAYHAYYTHADSCEEERHRRCIKDFFRAILYKTWGLFLRVTAIYRERKRLNLMYLDKDKPGKLLEIGCGNGRRLAEFCTIGWHVEGQEVDLEAGKIAQQAYGFKMHFGSIDELKIPDKTFDAIIMNHVIEHVHYPEKVIARCRRLLKLGGTLVVVTPNVESLGFWYFGESWRGLEPPRHLHIFSCKTLQVIAHKAGFAKYSAFTTMGNAQIIAGGSFDIKNTGHHAKGSNVKLYRHITSVVFQLWAAIVYLVVKGSGEECVLVATK